MASRTIIEKPGTNGSTVGRDQPTSKLLRDGEAAVLMPSSKKIMNQLQREGIVASKPASELQKQTKGFYKLFAAQVGGKRLSAFDLVGINEAIQNEYFKNLDSGQRLLAEVHLQFGKAIRVLAEEEHNPEFVKRARTIKGNAFAFKAYVLALKDDIGLTGLLRTGESREAA